MTLQLGSKNRSLVVTNTKTGVEGSGLMMAFIIGLMAALGAVLIIKKQIKA